MDESPKRRSRNTPPPLRKKTRRNENLSLKNIYVGEVDTTIEIKIGGREAIGAFYESYFVRNQTEIDDFIVGKKLYVYGQKGVGKTAFLRYIEENMRRDKSGSRSSEMFFFTQDFPTRIHHDITRFLLDQQSIYQNKDGVDNNLFRDLDYEDFWIYTILKRISEFSQTTLNRVILSDENLKAFQRQFSLIEPETVFARFARLVQNPKSVVAKLSAQPEIEVKYEFDGTAGDIEKFNQYVKAALELFKKLNLNPSVSHRIFFDEIDPRVGNGRAFDLDCILIRDLVVAIYKLNTARPEGHRQLVFSAAIRSEVFRAVNKLGKEIHKLIEQAGVYMTWGEFGKRDVHHPLVKMVCRKIIYSEKKAGIFPVEEEENLERIWKKYFIKSGTEILSVAELLRLTWFKPRDLVRLLSTCKKIDGESRVFSAGLLERSRKIYANDSWQEIQSQLSASMGPGTVGAIESILTRYKDIFSFNDLRNRIKSLSVDDESIRVLFSKNDVGGLVRTMYINGIIGNIYGRTDQRFYFLGDNDPDLGGDFILHPALIAKFVPVRIDRKTSDYYPDQQDFFDNAGK